jgi:hypothetical protein
MTHWQRNRGLFKDPTAALTELQHAIQSGPISTAEQPLSEAPDHTQLCLSRPRRYLARYTRVVPVRRWAQIGSSSRIVRKPTLQVTDSSGAQRATVGRRLGR